MTMQSSGPISMGQAMNECQVGGRYNAGSYALSNLAKVGQGSRYAWSYWYGKTHLVAINNVVFDQIHVYVDRNGTVTVNFRTGSVTPSNFNGDHGPGLRDWQQIYPPVGNIAAYSSWSASVVKTNGRSNVSLANQPAPGNDFTVSINFDDNPWGGATDVNVNLMLTCNP